MSKSLTVTVPKKPRPGKSAWARGPPQRTTAPSPRSQSPVASTPIHQTHSFCSIDPVQDIPIKIGVTLSSQTGPPQVPSQMQPQMHQHMPMAWQGYYQYPPPDQQQHYMYSQWYPAPMPMQPPHGQHQPPPPGPHALPNPVHAPHPPPALSHAANSIGGFTSPPPTPSSASIPRLNAGSNAFVPRQKVTLKKEDGTEVNLDNIAKSSPVPAATPPGSVYRQGSPGTPKKRSSVRIEFVDQGKTRLAQDEARETPHTPPTASIPRLNAYAGSITFAPRPKVTLKKMDGTVINLDNIVKSLSSPATVATLPVSVYGQGNQSKPNKRPTGVRKESKDQRKIRLTLEEARLQRVRLAPSDQLRASDGLASPPPTPTSGLTPFGLSRHPYTTVSAPRDLPDMAASLPAPHLGLREEEERRARAGEDGRDDDVAEGGSTSTAPATVLTPAAGLAPGVELPFALSLEDFCVRYGVGTWDRERLARLEFQPGDEIETLPEDEWKGEGFTTLAWRRVVVKNNAFISDSRNGLWGY